MLIEQFRAIQLLDQLLVNAGLTRCSLCTQFNIYEVKYAVFKLLPVRLGLFHIATRARLLLRWRVISVVEMPVHLLPYTQKLRLFGLI